MSSLERRIERLEEAHSLNPKEVYQAEKLHMAIGKARKRILRIHPGYQFSAPENGSVPPGGKFDLVAALERGRRRAVERLKL